MARAATDTDPLALAQAAFDHVEADAATARLMAERALRLAEEWHLPEARVAALHALSFAFDELGDSRMLPTIRAAIRIAERHDLSHRAALARRRLALLLAYRGSHLAAGRELDRACAVFDAHELARSYVFRIAIAQMAGTPPPRVAETDRALATLRAQRDAVWEARLLRNRGALYAERGDAIAAEADLRRARSLFASLGARQSAFAAELQLVRLTLAVGDLPGCLARLDAIDASEIPAASMAQVELLRAQVLAAARLMDEAFAPLLRAEEVWRRSQVEDYEGRIEVIRLTLLAGDPALAARLARTAQSRFAAQGAEAHWARAVGLGLSAAVALRTVGRTRLATGRRAAETLEAAGWLTDALRIRLALARAALLLLAPAQAASELRASRALRRHAAIADRIEWWHIEALLRISTGNRTAALRAVSAGLRVLERHRASLGATEMRVTASAIGVELARVGLRIILSGRDAGAALRAAERLRASALRLDPVTPLGLPAMQASRRELRAVTAAIHRGERRGATDPALIDRQAKLELEVRRLSRHARGRPGEAAATARGCPATPELSAALGERALVELIELDGSLTALTLVGGRLARHELGSATAVAEEQEWLRFALARLARLSRGAPQRPALRDGVRACAQTLSELLVAPLTPRLGERELVLVPTGPLHAMPWAVLPGLGGRTLTVAPSAAFWVQLSSSARRSGRGRGAGVALVSGPGLRHARSELNAIGDLYAGAITLSGRHATVNDVLAALDGAAVAHLACHGRFRADSPLFSSLELADGPLNVYELEQLRRPPELVVLSSCDLATSAAHPGDELLGFAAALLNMGTRSVIASTVPVPDAAAKRLMQALHEQLVVGRPPARSLADAQQLVARDEPALTGFVCLGSG